jgi:hypothetical protein
MSALPYLRSGLGLCVFFSNIMYRMYIYGLRSYSVPLLAIRSKKQVPVIDSSWLSLAYDIKVVGGHLFCHLFFLKAVFYDGPESRECFDKSYYWAQKQSLYM